MALVTTYDPQGIVCSWNGVLISGFAEGTFVRAERTEDAFMVAVGSAGEVARVRNRNRSGTVTLTLMASSGVNDLLSEAANLDELTGEETGTFQVQDLRGTTLLVAESAWIKKLPATEYAKEMSSREWVFECAELAMFVGGGTL